MDPGGDGEVGGEKIHLLKQGLLPLTGLKFKKKV